MSIRFRKDSDERACGRAVTTGSVHDPMACMRTENHEGMCIAVVRDAAEADGVCHGCREPVGAWHKWDCYVAKP